MISAQKAEELVLSFLDRQKFRKAKWDGEQGILACFNKNGEPWEKQEFLESSMTYEQWDDLELKLWDNDIASFECDLSGL